MTLSPVINFRETRSNKIGMEDREDNRGIVISSGRRRYYSELESDSERDHKGRFFLGGIVVEERDIDVILQRLVAHQQALLLATEKVGSKIGI